MASVKKYEKVLIMQDLCIMKIFFLVFQMVEELVELLLLLIITTTKVAIKNGNGINITMEQCLMIKNM